MFQTDEVGGTRLARTCQSIDAHHTGDRKLVQQYPFGRHAGKSPGSLVETDTAGQSNRLVVIRPLYSTEARAPIWRLLSDDPVSGQSHGHCSE